MTNAGAVLPLCLSVARLSLSALSLPSDCEREGDLVGVRVTLAWRDHRCSDCERKGDLGLA